MDAPDGGTVAILAGAIVTLVGALTVVVRLLVKALIKVVTDVLTRVVDKIADVAAEVRGLRDDLRRGIVTVSTSGAEDDSDLVDEDPDDAVPDVRGEEDTPVHSIHAARERRAGRYGPGRPGGKDG